ncbi:FAD-dependent 5-carboxymethylaminomethyl-2-thiouridine(34) oxidoreductase MnmC [Duganella radicis]|uniref:FAD-dependent 5-carboxymethylaminomethyl-2-thiouridine(34) oxidoreductase MnmC n=1 Tax=Duganella radicis TaxID=551988 RepID=A0A6L6PMH5_9BURK|nr:FAD-dependent 5-carboxymethylaminomethyl-2-thiouridine(34) oxidoreductase MnmC [Duganella radicis]
MMMRVVLDTEWRGERFAAARAQGGRLHYIAVAPALPPADAVHDAELRAAWPLNVPGFHRVILNDEVTLDLLVGALDAVLPQVVARVNAFHLDAAVTPPMARTLAKLAVQGATLHARAAGEAMVWALTAAGFACRIAASPGDRTAHVERAPDITAVYRSRRPQPAMAAEPARRAVVIGAGLAGASAAHRLCARGWQVTLIERHAQPAQEASGNLAGIFMPLLSKDDNIPTRLSRAAYLFALREWRRLGGVGRAFEGADCGVLQLARDERHAVVQQEALAAWNYPQAYARWADAQEASTLIGATTPHGGWLFEQGGWARPSSLCEAMLNACGDRLQRVFHTEALSLQRIGDEWLVRGADGALIAQAPTAILAGGAQAGQIEQAAELPLFKLRGQVTHLALDPAPAAPRPPVLPLVVCREAYVTPPSNGIVCAGATYDNDDEPSLRASSQLENLTRLAEIIPGDEVAALAHSAPLEGRVGFRCAAPDRLPLAGALPDYPNTGRAEFLSDVRRHPGLHCLLGYASRGLIWAPLMAELLVSQLEHTPPPLETQLIEALDPGRFLLKQRRRSQ